MAKTIQARNYYALGDFVRCLECLDDMKIAFDSAGGSDTSAEINYYSLSALVELKKQRPEQSWIYAEV